MKKVFLVLAFVFSVGFASLFFFTNANQKLYQILQKNLSGKNNSVPLLMISVDESDIEKFGYSFFSEEKMNELKELAYELGAVGSICNLGLEKKSVEIDSFVDKENNNIENEKKMPLFNAKIVFSRVANSEIDKRTPELNCGFIPKSEFLNSLSFLGVKDGKYYANSYFSQLLEVIRNVRLKISSDEILLTQPADSEGGLIIDNLKIPRGRDGSVLMVYPRSSYKKYPQISFSELYYLSLGEKNLYKYLLLLEKRGFFGEVNTENPLLVFELSMRNENSLSERRNLKNRFYILMSSFLSGNQERILTEMAKNESEKSLIKNSFSLARKIFYDIETERTRLSAKIQESLCVFANVSQIHNSLVKTPYDDKFPECLESYVLANMLFSDDFINALPGVVSFFIALLSCLLFILLSLKIKKLPLYCVFSALFLGLVTSALVLIFLYCRVLPDIFVIFFSVLTLSIVLGINKYYLNACEKSEIAALFTQRIPSSLVRDVFRNPEKGSVYGDNNESTILSLSIQDISILKNLLNEGQLVSLFNYYFDKIAEIITDMQGVVESYSISEITAIFGSPVNYKEHYISALKSSFMIREVEKRINKEISYYPLSPKPDGMSDDLYTSFFILNHNNRKVLSNIGLYSGEVKSGCIGDKKQKSCRILDESAKKAGFLKNMAKKIGAYGVVMNENAAVYFSDSYLLRKLSFCEIENDLNEADFFEVMGDRNDDDDKLYNYVSYWNQAMDLLKRGEKQKSLEILKKLCTGRPSDNVAKYFAENLKKNLLKV